MPSNVGVALPVGNWPQINNVADSLNLNRLGLPPSLALKEQGINRYQQLANILMQRGLTPAQGQMAGRFYVPPTWAQGAAQLGSAAAGVGLNIAGEYQRQDIADESQNILSASLQKYRDSIAPQEVQTKPIDERSVNGSGVSPQLPYGIDPHTMPSQGWDINTYQPDTTQQVQDNKNAIALNTPPPQEQEAPLQGVYHDLTQAPMLDKQPLVDALQQRYDQGEQYTRQPFQQPQSQVTVSGAESAMQERTPEQKQQALVELMASQHPQAQQIAQLLMQQEQQKAQQQLQAQQAIMLEKMKEQAAIGLKQTPSADNQADIAARKELHKLPSGNAILGARDQVVTTGPNGEIVPNQPVIDAKTKIAEAGASKQQTIVNSFTPAAEEGQKKYMDNVAKQREALQAAPQALANIEKAKALIPQAKGFMGPGGEGLLEASKFLNNRLGFQINTEGIKSAEELRSRIFFNIMDSLKKMDAQPSEMQQKVMMESLGKLGTDPNALPVVLDAFAESIRGKVDLYNQDVSGAIKKNPNMFPYDPIIKLPDKARTVVKTGTANGRKVVEYSDGSIEYAE